MEVATSTIPNNVASLYIGWDFLLTVVKKPISDFTYAPGKTNPRAYHTSDHPFYRL